MRARRFVVNTSDLARKGILDNQQLKKEDTNGAGPAFSPTAVTLSSK